MTSITAVAAPLPAANIDTDQIIPARFLMRSRRADYAALLFHDHRFDAGGTPKDFVLNDPTWRSAGILVAGANFGCGSAREQAVWAIADFGIRVIVAPSFGAIFRGNCTRNGILAARVEEDRMTGLWRAARTGETVTADLRRRVLATSGGEEIGFEIPEADRHRLLEGLDDVAITLQHVDEIAAFEARQADGRPWALARPDGA
ncbi:3-isopropylmalate dehydratase small subunit [Ancylobacter sp. GSK1Z-4-2]|nr:3-isopropylmalate dehydratase small subunit [Ancylobacter mangrovi]